MADTATLAAPFCDVDTLTGGRPILVLAPHPDDESLGCGGLLAASFAGSGAHVVCVTDGRFSHPNSHIWTAPRLAELRRQELLRAVQALGGRDCDITFLDFHDCHAPTEGAELERTARKVARLCRAKGIRTLFATAPEDPHKDHGAVAMLARETVRITPGLRLFDYSVWARWQGLALSGSGRMQLETAPWQADKARAIACHRSQLGQIIGDDPEGFVMTPHFVDFFTRSPEWFRRV